METPISHPLRHREGLYGGPRGGWRPADLERSARNGSAGGCPTILTSPDTIGVVVKDEQS